MTTHLFRLKKERLELPNLKAGLLKFLNADLLIYSSLSLIISFLIIIIYVFVFQRDLSISITERLVIIYDMLLFFLKLSNRIYFFNFIIYLFLAYKIVFEFFKILSFNSIKTNNVLVDTSDLIQTVDDIFKTPKYVCWMFGEIDPYLFQNAPKDSLMKKIWLTKNLPDGVCRFKKDLSDQKLIINIENYFLLSKKSTTHFLIRVMSKVKTILQEANLVRQMRII